MEAIIRKYLPWLIVCIVMYLVYQLALVRTIELIQEKAGLEERMERAGGATKKIKHLQHEVAVLKQGLSGYTIDSTKNKSYIFNSLSDFCSRNAIQLSEFPIEGINDQGDYRIETNVVVAKGTYQNLLKLLHDIEYRQKIGRVSSADFFSVFDYKKNKDDLYIKIYIQTIGLK